MRGRRLALEQKKKVIVRPRGAVTIQPREGVRPARRKDEQEMGV